MTRDPLLRSFAGALLGYVAFATVMFAGMIAFNAWPADDLLEPGRFAPKPVFIIGQLAVAFLAAFAAGWFGRKVAGRRKPVMILLAIILLFSLFQVLFALSTPQPTVPRTGGESQEVAESAKLAEQPVVLILGTPLMIAAGMLLGSSQRLQRKS